MTVVSAFARVATALRATSPRAFAVELGVVALGVGFTVLGATAIVADKPPGADPPPLSVTLALLVPMLLVVLVRRRLPLSALAANTVLLGVVRELDVPELQVSSICWVVVLYAAGRYGVGRGRVIVRALAIAGVSGLLVRDVVTTWDDVEAIGYTERTFLLVASANIVWNLVMFVGAWYAGDLARKRFHRDQELAARTIELEASREENARRAVMDERVRIAREIHDVVAHHVSVMGVQAAAARRALHVDAERAEEPLRDIEHASREAVGELHRLLGFLRRVDDVDPDGVTAAALAPQPGLARLPELRRQLAAVGLAVRFTSTGAERDLPPSVDLSAYRIVQEALTNCLKYAGVEHAELEIDYGVERLTVAVRDRGRGPIASAGSTGPGGAGLTGMAERVALLGGRLRHGARPGGGFQVEAELPYDGMVAAAPSTSPPGAPPTGPGPGPGSNHAGVA